MLTLSTLALVSPWVSAASMAARCSRMVRASSTNASIFDRDAHANHALSRAIPASPRSLNT